MARTTFYEESATSVNAQTEARIAKAYNIASIIALSIAALIVFLSLTYIPSMFMMYEGVALVLNLIVFFAPILALIGLFFLFRHLKRKKNISYDYTFVEDEVRITKVFNGKSRKFQHTLSAAQMLKIGYVDKDSFRRTLEGVRNKKAVYLTPNKEPAEGKIFIYILYSSSIEKTLYVLECRQQMLEYIVLAAGINKFERQ